MQILLRDGLADLQARKVWRQGQVSRLSEAEVGVLGLLASRIGETVDRDRLLVDALGHAPSSLSRAVDLCIHRLRQKIEVEPARPAHLLTSQGAGYRLLPATEVAVAWSNLPSPRSTLVGRAALVEQALAAALAGPIALVGPSGVGKTTVALHLATSLVRTRAPAGGFWVDAAALPDLAALVRAIAVAAGLQSDTLAGLAVGFAARGPTVLAIDTCERALGPVSAVVAGLGAACRLVLTSRVPVPGARSVEVGPLGPAEASALLVERAREAGFAGPLDAERVARVVEALDRLPLGIELAAARLPAMSLARIEQELERPLRLLRGKATGRQASVESSVRWSWDALAVADREPLVRLAVFQSPVPAEAASAMVGAEVVQRLVSAHLLRVTDQGVTPWHAVGELAESLAAPESWASARRDHAEWVAARARVLVPALWTAAYPAALAELERLAPDLALAEAVLDEPSAVLVARVEVDHELARFASVVERVDRALVSMPPGHPARPGLRAAAASAMGKLGRYEEAATRARDALAEAAGAEDRVAAGSTLATALIRMSRKEEARSALARLWADAGRDPVLVARAWGAQVMLESSDWPGEAGVRTLEAALRAAEDAGVARVIPVATHNLAVGYHRSGQVERAERQYELSVPLLQRNRRACGLAWHNLSILRFATDPEASLHAAQQAFGAFSDAGAVDGQRVAIGMAAMAHAVLGEPIDALAEADEACARLDGQRGVLAVQTLALRAGINALLGRAEAATAFFAEIGPYLAEDLTILPEDAEALMAAWLHDRPMEADRAERLEAVVGDRRWLQVQLLRHAGRVQRPSTQSSSSSPT